MKFQNIILGGTFDLLHEGHKALLNKAFEAGEEVIIGITIDDYLDRFKIYDLRFKNYKEREEEVINYLEKNNWIERAKIIEINDKFGTTLTDRNLEAIVISPETKKTALEINQLRKEKNWPELEIIEIPWVMAKDGKPINSVRIRNGEINRQGELYSLPEDWGMRMLPDDLRQKFKKPLGRLISDLSSLSRLRKIIAIGDATVSNLLKIGITPDISIIDLKIQRRQVYKNVSELGFRNIKVIKKVKNSAGTLSFESFQILNSLIKSEAKPVVLQVIGEDDLFTLLAAFLAPLRYLIVYGQPNRGAVVIQITEDVKEKMREYLGRFIV